jgi:hypothetical protein
MTQPDPADVHGPAEVDYFVDEAGDTTLFRHGGQPAIGRDGVSNFFILGRLEIDDAAALAADIATLRQRLLADPLLNAVPSMQPERGKTARFFHAKDDVPEVRVEVFRLLLAHDLRFSAIVKDKRVLLGEAQAALAADPRAKYKPDGHALYDAMMRKLFERLGRHGVHSRITFAVRGNKPRTAALKHAVLEVEQRFERDFGFARSVSIDVASGYPWDAAGLQACDYFLWALQRFYERSEARFLNAMWTKVVEVIDMDLEAPKRRGKPRERGVTFTKENPLGLATRAGLAGASKLGPGDIG